MTTGSIEQRLDRMEEHLTRHSECLEEITRSIEAVNIGIQGNREHDRSAVLKFTQAGIRAIEAVAKP